MFVFIRKKQKTPTKAQLFFWDGAKKQWILNWIPNRKKKNRKKKQTIRKNLKSRSWGFSEDSQSQQKKSDSTFFIVLSLYSLRPTLRNLEEAPQPILSSKSRTNEARKIYPKMGGSWSSPLSQGWTDLLTRTAWFGSGFWKITMLAQKKQPTTMHRELMCVSNDSAVPVNVCVDSHVRVSQLEWSSHRASHVFQNCSGRHPSGWLLGC